ncbi:hypothetical protein [Chitinophaga nivalis]|uniref:YD repeat-containing protein n=1 Tax=Chitinophaga nivalis TaxID=2991709 RepID=A0ABT3IU88_9BACT|nr:hypothetical protein [Chitinophaga nivalis]MCW3462749.1 hypothetical protein [Chitinophaga nivalis]MCW3487561.1 hypothetical protein [Chitinophaga nivalis]
MKYFPPAILQLFVWVLLLPPLVQAQVNTPQFTNYMIPPPPNAAALGRYGEIPVNLNTGIPNIDVPLLEIKSGRFTLPVSLSYHASGIKVGQLASQTGLGWALNTGGCITRSIVGLPDEGVFGFNSIKSRGGLPMGYEMQSLGDAFLLRYVTGKFDTESDYYYYNIPGRSGRFMFFDTVYRTIPYSKLDIRDTRGAEFKKKITDENGYIYEFNDVEEVQTQGSNAENPQLSPQAWYISKITSPEGTDSILYEYENHNYFVPVLEIQETKKVPYLTNAVLPIIDEKVTLTQYVKGVLLKAIKTNSSSTRFFYSGRTDSEDKKLDSILHTDARNNRIRKYTFSYSYFSRNGPLKLDSVIETGSTTASKPAYTFEYDQPDNIPAGWSASQDHWGYYNGADNRTLIPAIMTNQGEEILADRESNRAYITAGALKKITYPTGGYTAFVFESNDHSNILGRPLPDAPITETSSIDMELYYKINGPKSTSDTLTINMAQRAQLSYSFSNCVPTSPGCTSYAGEAPGVSVEVNRLSDGINIYFAYATEPNKFNSKSADILLPPGKYQVKLMVSSPYDAGIVSLISKRLVRMEPVRFKPCGGIRIATITNYDGISHTNDVIKTYRYTLPDSACSSGTLGATPSYAYSYTQYTNTEQPGPIPSFCGQPITYHCYTSFSQSVLGSAQGGHVGYSCVTEHLSSKDTTNKTVSFFTTAIDYGDFRINDAPFPNPVSFDWKRGLLKEKQVYGPGNKLVMREKKVYATSPKFQYELPNFKASQVSFCETPSQNAQGQYNEIRFKTHYSTHVTEWQYLLADTIVYYSPNSNDSLRTISTYAYDTSSLNPAIITKTSSDKIIADYFKYPFNYTITGTGNNNITKGIRNLQNKYIINPVIEKYTTVNRGADTSVISGQFISYKAAQPFPDTIFRLETSTALKNFTPAAVSNNILNKDSRYQPELIFDLYDTKGNVLQQHKANSFPESFIWAYDNQYPVLSASGVDYSTLQSNTNISLLNSTFDDQQISSQTTALRNNFLSQPILINTYTFRPLIGMTRATDPMGKTVYYEYDTFGRLKLIRDQDGKILKQFSYQYQQSVTQ